MPRILHLRLWQRWKVGQWRWPSPNNAKCLSPKNAAKQTFTASDAIFSSVSLRKTPQILCTRLKNNAKECRKTQNAQVFLVKSHRGERFVTNKAKRAQQQYKRARRNNSRHSRLQLVVVEGDLLEIVVQVGKKRTDNFDEGWPHGGAVVPAHQHQVVPVGVETKTRLKTSIASPPLLPFLHATHAAQASICSKPMPFCKNFILVTATERSRSAAAIHSVDAERSLGKSVHLNCPPPAKSSIKVSACRQLPPPNQIVPLWRRVTWPNSNAGSSRLFIWGKTVSIAALKKLLRSATGFQEKKSVYSHEVAERTFGVKRGWKRRIRRKNLFLTVENHPHLVTSLPRQSTTRVNQLTSSARSPSVAPCTPHRWRSGSLGRAADLGRVVRRAWRSPTGRCRTTRCRCANRRCRPWATRAPSSGQEGCLEKEKKALLSGVSDCNRDPPHDYSCLGGVVCSCMAKCSFPTRTSLNAYELQRAAARNWIG